MRIVFAGGGTGGHLYPALAIAREVVRLDPSAQPFFVGAERGVERTILPDTGFPFRLLDLHPLYRSRPWENWRTLRGLARAWRALNVEFTREWPALVVGTGGYASAAALGWARSYGVPYALQEQNGAPGITTKWFAPDASAVFVGVPEAAQALRVRDASVIRQWGNPITPPPEPRPDRIAVRGAWGFSASDMVVLAFGGSQGARGLNEAIASWIARGLPDDVSLIWGTGRAEFDRYASLRSRRVAVQAYLSPIANAYAAADLAITRAGALTIAELCAWGIPGILVPLPTAAADHQTTNARALEAAGGAMVIREAELDASRLDASVRTLMDPTRRAAMAAAAVARAHPRAAEEIAGALLGLVKEKG